ncbi:MAG: hypothetical protein D4R65_05705 [Verrucomicrobiaceae bacterium]|nr:MAG: hypothetical protein D4R65_05705 [Verrucomicrobiaceae bacterium]
MMKLRILAAFVLALPFAAKGADDSFHAPDSIVLKDGRTIRGLIVKNSVDSVLIQEEFSENTYPKSEIVRIRDEADIGVLFTDITRRGDLPSWRVMANDLRMHDEVKSLVEIPATTISIGDLRNVPYKSFRVNHDIELNIYGDPNDPSGVELGIYGSRKSNTKLQKVLRAYLAGFLTSREELKALYGINLKGGKAVAGDITFKNSPPTEPDAFGAWWVSLLNLKDLNAIRLSDAKYAKLTRPADEVIDRSGRVIAKGWTKNDLQEMEHHKALHGKENVLIRGFYRNANGDFQLLEKKSL